MKNNAILHVRLRTDVKRSSLIRAHGSFRRDMHARPDNHLTDDRRLLVNERGRMDERFTKNVRLPILIRQTKHPFFRAVEVINLHRRKLCANAGSQHGTSGRLALELGFRALLFHENAERGDEKRKRQAQRQLPGENTRRGDEERDGVDPVFTN